MYLKYFTLFCVPLVYLFRTRPHAVVSLFFTHLLPIVFLYGMQTGFTVQTLALSLSTLLIVECVYEIGYIQNDTETVKRDDSPTWRLNGTELDFYYQHKRVVYISRIIQTIAFLTMLHFFFPHAHTIYFAVGLLVLLISFLLYNSLSGYVKMFLYFILSSLRYIIPFLLFPENISVSLLVLLLLIHSFVRTLEFKSSKPPYITTNICFRKYIIRYDVSRLYGFRVIAYFLLLLVSAVLYRISFFPFYYLLIMLYVLSFRTAIYMFSKRRTR